MPRLRKDGSLVKRCLRLMVGRMLLLKGLMNLELEMVRFFLALSLSLVGRTQQLTLVHKRLVALFWDTKFKHNLSSTRLGTSELPRIFIVASYDSSKQKLRTVEVGMKDGAVVEGAHRLLDLKEGKVVVQRVLAAR